MAKKRNKRKKKVDKQLKHKKMLEKQSKDFFCKLVEVAAASNAEDAFYKILPSELLLMQKIKFGSFRIKKAEHAKFSKHDIKTLQKVTHSVLKTKMLSIAEGCPQISLLDYFSAGLTLYFYIKCLKDNTFPEAKEVKDSFQALSEFTETSVMQQKLMHHNAVLLSWTFSCLNQGFFTFKLDTVYNQEKSSYACYIADVIEPEIRHFSIDGKNRPAYRMGYIWKETDVNWVKIKASDMGVISSFGDLELDVYIQSHALTRLEERLDVFKLSEPNSYLFSSFLEPVIIKNFKGRTLIKYGNFADTLGYLVAEVIDGAILIKTFLFITNDGTPEGEKLKELAGLSITGKKYFKIDTLSTFFFSDIEDDETLKELFINAGCESLFKIKAIYKRKEADLKTASALLKYLEFDTSE